MTIPDHETILRRRHACVCLLRIGAAAWLAWIVGEQFFYFVSGVLYNPLSQTLNNLGEGIFLYRSVHIIGGILILHFSRRLAFWLIPDGFRNDLCRACGYSLKTLKSPVCPECGANIRPSA